MTTTKQPIVAGDHLPITTYQITRIMKNCAYDIDIKNEWVQWATGDVNRTSLKSITQAEAIKIIRQQEGLPQEDKTAGVENWASFTSQKPNPQKRKVLFSLMHQAGWTTTQAGREGYSAVPDLLRLSAFLQSEKSPVKKKLVDMDIREMEKLIRAFKGIVQSIYK
jgi:hypothetical protein